MNIGNSFQEPERERIFISDELKIIPILQSCDLIVSEPFRLPSRVCRYRIYNCRQVMFYKKMRDSEKRKTVDKMQL